MEGPGDRHPGAVPAQHPDINIDLQEMPSSAYVPRMNTALAAGEAPDIIALNAGRTWRPRRRPATSPT